MIITFLGTAAANAFPEAFCTCPNCQEARKMGGKSLRKRSSVLINYDLLIDLGPDIMSASQIHNIDLTKVRYCLQTHPHADHLDLSHLLSRSPEYGVVNAPLLHFYASPETLQTASNTFRRDLADFDLLSKYGQNKLNLQTHTIHPGQSYKIGEYEVIPFQANHQPNPGAMIFVIKQDGHTILYGVDTASFFDETWLGFHQFNLKFDLIVFDHTYGPQQAESDHLNAESVQKHIHRLQHEDLLQPGAAFFASHIAHEGNPAHSNLAEYAAQYGYQIAYDGLMVEIL
ncbi:MAG: hypothetical protein CL609_15015 [Anaerolineaceae bacterium]|nr:hypothetical protein [Anaerolineaceae bacterium]